MKKSGYSYGGQYEKAEKERQKRYAQIEKDRQRRYAQMDRDRQQRQKHMDDERKRREKDRTKRYEQMERDRQRRYTQMDKERVKRHERLEKERLKREKAYKQTGSMFGEPFAETRRKGFFGKLFAKITGHEQADSHTHTYSDHTFNYESYINDLLGDILEGQASRVQYEEHDISPAERKRRELMHTLPSDTVQVLNTCDERNVRSVIATVYRAREVDADRTDWDIYVAYRRSIEVESPEPAMVEKTQIAGILLEGTRKEAHFPF